MTASETYAGTGTTSPVADAVDWDDVWDADWVEVETGLSADVTAPGDAAGQDNAVLTNVDIVFVIDATGSMAPCIRQTTAVAADLLPRIQEALGAKKRRVDQLRTKVIAFRDYYCDNEPMVQSQFYQHPGQEAAFRAFLDGLEATGGGDAPENSLEALYEAIKSDWVDTGAKRRHIVVLMTDAAPHPLDHPKRASAKGYPADMPKNLTELMLAWDDGQGKLNSNARRMAVFAPEDKVWRGIADTWELVSYMPCRAAAGLADADMDVVVKWIAESI